MGEREAEAGLRLSVAGTLRRAARPEEALRFARRALEINQELHANDHRDVANSLSSVADCLQQSGQLREALHTHEAALEMRQRLYPGDHFLVWCVRSKS